MIGDILVKILFMKNSRLFLCLLSICILGFSSCKTKEVVSTAPPEADSKIQTQKTQVTSQDALSLETLLDQNSFFSLIQKENLTTPTDLQDEFLKTCEKISGLCGRPPSAREERSNTFKRHEIIRAFREQKWDQVSQFTTNHVIQGLRNENQQAVHKYATQLPPDKCEYSSARFGLGLLLEKWLPEEETFQVISQLYHSNSNCPENNEMLRSSLRGSLLRISKGQCQEAEFQLRNLEKSTDSSFRSRGIYWLKECGLRQNITESEFPFLSFHGFKAREQFHLNTPPLPLDPSTPVSRRFVNQPELNRLTEIVEMSLAQNRFELSRWMVEKINLDELRTWPAENQVYWGYIAFLSGAHLRKMQILNPLVISTEVYQTRTIRDLLYPWIYSEEIEAQKSEIPTELIMALIRQESAFDLRARSRVGATGLMQLMYSTARLMDRSMSRRDLLNPEKNIRVGTKYFEKLWKSFDGQAMKALAAYNAGPLRVIEWQKRYPVKNDLLFAELIPYMETRDYVALVLRNFYIYQQIKIEKEKIHVTETASLNDTTSRTE